MDSWYQGHNQEYTEHLIQTEIPSSPWHVCLHFLLDDNLLYWWQIAPPSVFAEAWIQVSDVYGRLHSSSNHVGSVTIISVLSNFTESRKTSPTASEGRHN